MKLSDAEWKVMQALWRRAPASARDILEEVEEETGWAYTTVKTMLSRLVEKGAAAARMRANTSLYTPLVSRRQARSTALRGFLHKAFDGLDDFVQYLSSEEELSSRDKARLKKILARRTGEPEE